MSAHQLSISYRINNNVEYRTGTNPAIWMTAFSGDNNDLELIAAEEQEIRSLKSFLRECFNRQEVETPALSIQGSKPLDPTSPVFVPKAMDPTSAVFVPRTVAARQFVAGRAIWQQEPQNPPYSSLANSKPSREPTTDTPSTSISGFWETSDDINDRRYETWADDEIFLPGYPYGLLTLPAPDSGYASEDEAYASHEHNAHHGKYRQQAPNDRAIYAHFPNVLQPGDMDDTIDLVDVSRACRDIEDILVTADIIGLLI